VYNYLIGGRIENSTAKFQLITKLWLVECKTRSHPCFNEEQQVEIVDG